MATEVEHQLGLLQRDHSREKWKERCLQAEKNLHRQKQLSDELRLNVAHLEVETRGRFYDEKGLGNGGLHGDGMRYASEDRYDSKTDASPFQRSSLGAPSSSLGAPKQEENSTPYKPFLGASCVKGGLTGSFSGTDGNRRRMEELARGVTLTLTLKLTLSIIVTSTLMLTQIKGIRIVALAEGQHAAGPAQVVIVTLILTLTLSVTLSMIGGRHGL